MLDITTVLKHQDVGYYNRIIKHQDVGYYNSMKNIKMLDITTGL